MGVAPGVTTSSGRLDAASSLLKIRYGSVVVSDRTAQRDDVPPGGLLRREEAGDVELVPRRPCCPRRSCVASAVAPAAGRLFQLIVFSAQVLLATGYTATCAVCVAWWITPFRRSFAEATLATEDRSNFR